MSALSLRRVGHKGADLIAPGNTTASFDAALAAGVDMIEFDVLPLSDGRLVLAHDLEDATIRTPLTLAQGLEHLAGERFAGLDFAVDLKVPGIEAAVLAALAAHGLGPRSLICSQYPRSLALLRALDPEARLGWSVPRLRHDPFRTRALGAAAWAGLQIARAGLPARAGQALRARRCDALMAHWRLVTAALVREVRAAGGELYVWTVDDGAHIEALRALGVTGVITNDPRLFASLSA